MFGRDTVDRGANSSSFRVSIWTFLSVLVILIGVVLFSSVFFGPNQNLVSNAAGEKSNASNSPSDLINVIIGGVSLVVAFIGLLLTQLDQRISPFSGKIEALQKDVSDQKSEISKIIKEKFDLQTETTIEKLDRVQSRIDNIEEKFAWLKAIGDIGVVVNVKSAAAVIETVSKLLETNDRTIAYEWLSESSRDRDLVGAPEDFIFLAVVSKILFNDSTLVDAFYSRVTASGPQRVVWNSALAIYFLKKGFLAQAQSHVEKIEKIIIKPWGHEFAQRFKGRRPLMEIGVPQGIATVLYFYELTGDTQSIKRFNQSLKSRFHNNVIISALDLKRAIALEKLTTGNDLIGLPFTIALGVIEKNISDYIRSPEDRSVEIDTIIRNLFESTGNRTMARALRAVVRDVMKDRIIFGMQVRAQPSALG